MRVRRFLYQFTVFFLIGILFYTTYHPQERAPERSVSCNETNSQYQHCLFEKVPYISTGLETVQYLLYTHSSFIRFGDADVELILGWDRYFQKANQSLSDILTYIFENPLPDLVYGLYDTFSGFPPVHKGNVDWWHHQQHHYREWVLRHCNYSQQYFSAMVSSPYVHYYSTNCGLLSELYTTFRKIWSGEDIVLLRGDNGQHYDYDVYNTSKSQVVYYAPRYQAWSSYAELKDRLFAEDSNKLFIVSVGPVGKVIAYDLVKAGRRVLDLGHLAKDYNLYASEIDPRTVPSFYRD